MRLWRIDGQSRWRNLRDPGAALSEHENEQTDDQQYPQPDCPQYHRQQQGLSATGVEVLWRLPVCPTLTVGSAVGVGVAVMSGEDTAGALMTGGGTLAPGSLRSPPGRHPLDRVAAHLKACKIARQDRKWAGAIQKTIPAAIGERTSTDTIGLPDGAGQRKLAATLPQASEATESTTVIPAFWHTVESLVVSPWTSVR